jgi:hypothetical protein
MGNALKTVNMLSSSTFHLILRLRRGRNRSVTKPRKKASGRKGVATRRLPGVHPTAHPQTRRTTQGRTGAAQKAPALFYSILTVTKCIKVSFPRRNTGPAPSCRARPITSNGSTARYGSASPGWCAPRCRSRRNWPIISAQSSISFAITTSPEVQPYLDSTTICAEAVGQPAVRPRWRQLILCHALRWD